MSDATRHNATARPETTHRGSTPAVKTYTTGAPKSRGLPLDEARLRPHLRQVKPTTSFQPGQTHMADEPTLGQHTKTLPVPSPGELRGIPVIGHGGAIPGTDPARQAEHLDRSAA